MLIVFWVGAGAMLVGILGFVLGWTERAVLPFVLGIVAVTVILPLALLFGASAANGQSLGALARLKPEDPPAPDLPRLPARIESVRELGVTIRNFHHLYEFTVTVFPEEGGARAEVFSQLITMGQLPNFYTGRYVVLAMAPGTPPNPRLDPAPDAEWAAALRRAPERYDEIPAPSAQATQAAGAGAGSGAGSGTGVGTGAPVSGRRTALNLVLVAACLAAGAALAVQYTFGGFQRLGTVVAEVPQRLTGQVHGTWDSAQLALDLADLRDELRDRELVYLYVFDGYYSIAAYSTTDPRGEDVYAFRGGALSLSWTSVLSGSEGRFTVDQIDPEAVRSAVARVYSDTPDASISNVGIRPQGGSLVIDVSIEGTYEDTSRRFDALSGEEIADD